MSKILQCNTSLKMLGNYEKLAKIIEVKYEVNLKRFCFHLVKIGKNDFLVDFVQKGFDFPPIQKEIDRANKIFRCNLYIILKELCTKIEQDEYILFIETLSRIYENEKIMFIKY